MCCVAFLLAAVVAGGCGGSGGSSVQVERTLSATVSRTAAVATLSPTADQIQLGKDGKYFIADRGDGCMWVEYLRDTSPEIGLQVFLRTDCAVDFGITFRPESGEVLRLS